MTYVSRLLSQGHLLHVSGSLLPSQRFALSDSVSSLHKAFDGRKSGSTNTLNAAPHHGSDVDLSGNAKLDQVSVCLTRSVRLGSARWLYPKIRALFFTKLAFLINSSDVVSR